MGNIFVQNFSKNRLTKVQRVWYNRKPGEASVAGPLKRQKIIPLPAGYLLSILMSAKRPVATIVNSCLQQLQVIALLT